MVKYEVAHFDDVEKAIIQKDDSYQFQSELWEYCFNVLDSREIAIMLALEEGKTQSQIANDWGVDRSNISRLVDKVRLKIKDFAVSKRMIKE